MKAERPIEGSRNMFNFLCLYYAYFYLSTKNANHALVKAHKYGRWIKLPSCVAQLSAGDPQSKSNLRTPIFSRRFTPIETRASLVRAFYDEGANDRSLLKCADASSYPTGLKRTQNCKRLTFRLSVRLSKGQIRTVRRTRPRGKVCHTPRLHRKYSLVRKAS